MLKRIIGLGVAATAVSMVAAAATAHNLKRSLVPTSDPSADEIVAVAILRAGMREIALVISEDGR